MFSLGSIHPVGLTGGPLLATQPLDCIGNHGRIGRRVSRLCHLPDFGSSSVNLLRLRGESGTILLVENLIGIGYTHFGRYSAKFVCSLELK